MSILLTVSADTPEDFLYKLQILTAFVGRPEPVTQTPAPKWTPAHPGMAQEAEDYVREDREDQADEPEDQAQPEPEPAPAPEAPKKRAGRPRKSPDKVEPVDTLETEPLSAAADKDLSEGESERDPAADWADALVLLREVYGRPGAMEHVQSLLAKYAVAKFSSIAVDMGTDLLEDAQLMAAKVPA